MWSKRILTQKKSAAIGIIFVPEYVELKPGADADAFENKIKNILAKHVQTTKIEWFCSPQKTGAYLPVLKTAGERALFNMCTCWHHRPAGFSDRLHQLCELSTARAEKRAREWVCGNR